MKNSGVRSTFSNCKKVAVGVFAVLSGFQGAQAEDAATGSGDSPLPVTSDQWLLMDALHGTSVGSFMEDYRLNVYGWTEGSFTTSSAGSNKNTPNYFQNPTDRFLLNQNWLVVERTVDQSASEPTFGFHTAWILPGSDARYTVSRGLLDDQDGGRNSRIDAYHLFLEAYFPSVMKGLDIIVGKNATPVFYEVQDAPANALFSHSYIYQYGGPFTHTGIQAKLKISDTWAVDTRLVTGGDVFFDEAASPTFIASATYTAPDQNDAITLSSITGSGTYDKGEEFNHYDLLNAVYTHKFTPDLTYAIDAVFGFERNVPEEGNATWFGAANYLTYAMCDKTSVTTRIELFNDEDGVRSGNQGLYTEATVGVTIKLRKDVILRPEVRYDYNSESEAYDNDKDQFTAATDLILRW